MMKTWGVGDHGYLVECRATEGRVAMEDLDDEDVLAIVDDMISPLLNKFSDVLIDRKNYLQKGTLNTIYTLKREWISLMPDLIVTLTTKRKK